MKIEIQITNQLIQSRGLSRNYPTGAIAEFSGIVRDLENGAKISALEYEAYSPMAENEMRQILESLNEKFPCLDARVIHRVGIIPVGETAIYICIAAKHRGEAFAILAEFMNRLKQDVPIWKRRAITEIESARSVAATVTKPVRQGTTAKSLDDALVEISSRCQPLSGVRASLAESLGRIMCETVSATEDLPSADKSTRDGYAILQNDPSESFSVMDTIHAADWKPRQLKTGEAVRIATGGSLPCENVRVIMQENVERNGDKIKIIRHDSNLNIRKRGEEIRAGEMILKSGAKLDAGKLALLATIGCAQPLVSPKLKIIHFTTGDEIIPPEQKPKPGQIRDSNSILIRALLQKIPCELTQAHLPEDFELAKSQIVKSQIKSADVILVSGGASVGDKDFTRPLLEWLGFEIIFNRIAIRPGAPLIFGMNGNRVAFGLPGNPLSHFVCFHLFVAAALKKLVGDEQPAFLRGNLTAKLDDAPNSRETLWPARCEIENGKWELTPLRWSSSGDATCLAETNALIRVPANRGSIEVGEEVGFFQTNFE